MAESRNALSFQGKGSALFGKYLVNILLSVVTLGIYSFWGKVKILQYQYEQTQLGGSPFQFLGTGGQLFVGFLKFLGVIIVFELVVFGLVWLSVQMAMMNFGLLIFGMILVALVLVLFVGVLVPVAINSRLRYRLRNSTWRGLNGVYHGKNRELIPLFIAGTLLTFITLGIYAPWFSVKLRKYLYSNISFGNLTLRFDGKGGQLFLIGLKGLLLSAITLGIYAFWYARNLYRWSAVNSVVVQNGADHPCSTPVTAGKIFGFLFINILLLIVTLGIAFPWVVVRSMKFFFSNLVIADSVNLENLSQGATGKGDAIGESLGDFFDLGDFGLL